MDETWEHLFVACHKAQFLWNMVGRAAGIEGPFLQLKDTIFKWWNANCSAKLRPLFNAIPGFIL